MSLSPGQFLTQVDETAIRTVRTEQGEVDAGFRAFGDLHRSSVGSHFRLHPAGMSGIHLDFGVFEFCRKMNGEGVQRCDPGM